MSGQHVALVSQDARLADEIRRLCAMAGQPLQVVGQPSEVVRVCRSASLVVVDAEAVDLVGAALRGQPTEVILLTDDARRLPIWEAAVRVGARRVLSPPADNPQLLELLALSTESSGPTGPLLGVIGGRGGAGASTLAIALSWAVGESRRSVTLLDLDPWGGGLDVAVGLERVDGLRWPQLDGTRGVVAAAALRQQLPAAGGIAVLSMGASDGHERTTGTLPERAAIASVLDATRRGGGVVVADLLRWTGDAADAVIADCTTLLLVVPTEVRAVAAATASAHRLRALCDDIRLVTRTEPRSRLRDRDVTSALRLDHMATLRHESGLSAATDRGELLRWLRRSRLGKTARHVANQLVTGAAVCDS